jgi:hypothetical protein
MLAKQKKMEYTCHRYSIMRELKKIILSFAKVAALMSFLALVFNFSSIEAVSQTNISKADNFSVEFLLKNNVGFRQEQFLPSQDLPGINPGDFLPENNRELFHNDLIFLAQDDGVESQTDNLVLQIFEYIFILILGIIIFFIWIINTILFVILTILVWIVSFLLVSELFNPAKGPLFEAAMDPWNIFVGIANIMIIISFLAVGFAYILDIKRLKVNISDFLVKIILVAAITNFSLSLTATFINTMKGTTDIVIDLYGSGSGQQIPSGQAREEWRFQRVSGIFLGPLICAQNVNVSTEEQGSQEECQRLTLEGYFNSIWQIILDLWENHNITEAIATLIRMAGLTLVFFMSIAIFIGMIMAIVKRFVYLFGLMITSALVPAAWASPIPSFKRLSDNWFSKLITATFFYPIFVFALIILGLLTLGVSEALGSAVQQSDGYGDSALDATMFALIQGIFPILVLLVGLNMLGDYIEKTDQALETNMGKTLQRARRGMDFSRKALTGAAMGTRATSKAIRSPFQFAGKGIQGTARGLHNLRTRPGTTIRNAGSSIGTGIKRGTQSTWQAAKNVGWAAFHPLESIARTLDTFANLPEMGTKLANMPVNYVKGEAAKRREKSFAHWELMLRRNGMSRFADSDKDLNKFAGMNGRDLAEIRRRNPQYIDSEIRTAGEKAFIDKFPLPKLSTEALNIQQERWTKRIGDVVQGRAGPLNSRESTEYRNYLDQAMKNYDTRAQVLRDGNQRKFIRGWTNGGGRFQSGFYNSLDNEMQERLRKESPVLVGGSDQASSEQSVRELAMEAAQNEDRYREMDAANFDDPLFRKAFIEAHADKDQALKRLSQKTGVNSGYSPSVEEKRMQALEQRRREGKVTNVTRNLASRAADRRRTEGGLNENSFIREIQKIEDSSLDDDETKQARIESKYDDMIARDTAMPMGVNTNLKRANHANLQRYINQARQTRVGKNFEKAVGTQKMNDIIARGNPEEMRELAAAMQYDLQTMIESTAEGKGSFVAASREKAKLALDGKRHIEEQTASQNKAISATDETQNDINWSNLAVRDIVSKSVARVRAFNNFVNKVNVGTDPNIQPVVQNMDPDERSEFIALVNESLSDPTNPTHQTSMLTKIASRFGAGSPVETYIRNNVFLPGGDVVLDANRIAGNIVASMDSITDSDKQRAQIQAYNREMVQAQQRQAERVRQKMQSIDPDLIAT